MKRGENNDKQKDDFCTSSNCTIYQLIPWHGICTIWDELAKIRAEEIAERIEKEKIPESLEEINIDEDVPEDIVLDEGYDQLSTELGVPYSIVEEYMEQSSETFEQVEEAFEEIKKEEITLSVPDETEKQIHKSDEAELFATGDIQYNPKKLLERPYSYNQVGNLTINENSGAYRYEEVDLSLPGKGGLDLNIVRRYVSDMSNQETTVGVVYAGDTNKITHKVYMQAYSVGADDTLTLIPDINYYRFSDTGLVSRMNGLSSYFMAKDYEAAFAQLSYLKRYDTQTMEAVPNFV